ncbi:MAG: hypothetical protein D6705_09100 [Deltaproteobacteria bacterium]|nr:MAG: hypothetical protein D6705_09100 [Deltaproteobacteria bacterium]
MSMSPEPSLDGADVAKVAPPPRRAPPAAPAPAAPAAPPPPPVAMACRLSREKSTLFSLRCPVSFVTRGDWGAGSGSSAAASKFTPPPPAEAAPGVSAAANALCSSAAAAKGSAAALAAGAWSGRSAKTSTSPRATQFSKPSHHTAVSLSISPAR